MVANQLLMAESLRNKIERFWQLSGEKIRAIEREYDNAKGSPVYWLASFQTQRTYYSHLVTSV